MMDVDMFYKLCDMWNSHFGMMINAVGLLSIVFGLVVPILATLWQQKNLKNERDRWDKDVERKLSEFKKQRRRTSKQNVLIKGLQAELRSTQISLAQFYSDNALDLLRKMSLQKKCSDTELGLAIFNIIYALNCMIRSKREDNIKKCMRNFIRYSNVVTSDPKLLTSAIEALHDAFKYREISLQTKQLEKIIGADDQTYKDFVDNFAPLFDSLKTAYDK